MSFTFILGAIVCGLVVGVVVSNASISWGRELRRMYSAAPNRSRRTLLIELITTSLRRKEPWIIIFAVTSAFLLPREPWAKGLLAAAISWLAFFSSALLIAMAATSIYSAVNTSKGDPGRNDTA